MVSMLAVFGAYEHPDMESMETIEAYRVTSSNHDVEHFVVQNNRVYVMTVSFHIHRKRNTRTHHLCT